MRMARIVLYVLCTYVLRHPRSRDERLVEPEVAEDDALAISM